MNQRRNTKFQPILVPKTQFQSDQEAKFYLEKNNYNPNVSKTDNFYAIKPNRVGEHGGGTWQPQYQTEEYKKQQQENKSQLPLGSNPNTYTPKYLYHGSKGKPTLTPSEQHMMDKQGVLKKYINIHDMKAKGLDTYVPKGLDHYRRNKNLPFTMNKKKHEMMNSYAQPNFHNIAHTSVPGLSN